MHATISGLIDTILKNLYRIFYVDECFACVSVCASPEYQEPRENIRWHQIPGTGVRDGCRCWESNPDPSRNACSQLLNHLSSPLDTIVKKSLQKAKHGSVGRQSQHSGRLGRIATQRLAWSTQQNVGQLRPANLSQSKHIHKYKQNSPPPKNFDLLCLLHKGSSHRTTLIQCQGGSFPSHTREH